MEKQCQKCQTVADVGDDPLAACPKCGAIYSRVEAAARLAAERAEINERAEAKRRAQVAVLEQRQQSELQQQQVVRHDHGRPTVKPRRWFTPQFALVIYIVFAVALGLPTLVAGMAGGPFGWIILIGGFAMLGVGAVLLELILVVFHISATLEDCRAELQRLR